MKEIFYRRNSLFCINEQKLSSKANKPSIKNALYAAVYEEFKGAATNIRYKNLTSKQRLEALNQFALDWLRERGLE